MINSSMRLQCVVQCVGVIACGVLMLPMAAAAQVVGKAAAVNQDSTVAGRVLQIGASVIHKERIVTNARGSTQLLFIDQTTINIGPNCDIVIDEYVFDPNKGTGKLTVTLTKGLMRFVGGQITHNGSATVNTPPASIGIRGGLVDISTNGKTTSASNSFGTVTITGKTGPGAGTPVNIPQGSTGTGNGAGAPSVAPTTQQQVNSTNQQLTSKGTQTGGVPPSTSSTAATTSTKYSGTTSTITPSSNPAQGSTASGSRSGSSTSASSSNPNSASTNFTTGTPAPVTSASTTTTTSSGNSGAIVSQPSSGGPPLCGGKPC